MAVFYPYLLFFAAFNLQYAGFLHWKPKAIHFC